MHIREAGDAALVLELDPVIDAAVNARAIAIAAACRRMAPAGVRDVVATYRSVAVYFNPLQVDVREVREALRRASAADEPPAAGRSFDVPVAYGGDHGPDLADVAAFAGLTPDEVVSRHCSVDYRVFMLGFLPGFAYLGRVAPPIAAPRRRAPRLRVPAGSIGIAGEQTAVYPRDSPGGWQIVGRTPMRVFDPARIPPALFAPGDSVRFVPMTGDHVAVFTAASAEPTRASTSPDGALAAGPDGVRTGAADALPAIAVTRPGLFTTIQDEGRWGHQASGVSVSGAMDGLSYRLANALAGNDRGAAAIEATIIGPELRAEAPLTMVVSGADLSPTLDGVAIALNTPTRWSPGAVLRFGTRVHGARSYVAVSGGIEAPIVLGSRATHALSGLGGVHGGPLSAGDRLAVGRPTRHAARRRVDVLPLWTEGGVRLRVLPGPQRDFFSDEAYDALQRRRFRVAAQSDRMGYRLQGDLPQRHHDQMISDVTFTGALQVPPSGEPILLMNDRQTTGGYPQIAIVITADLPLAAQLAPGDWVEFESCTRAQAMAALIAQEGKLLACG